MRNGKDFESMFMPRQYAQATEEATSSMFGVMKGAEPALKAVARTNLEWMRFASKRAQAAVAVPSRLAACRTPHDLMTEQVRFWQTAFEQYAETTRQIGAIWSNINPAAQMMSQHFETWQQQNEAAKAAAAAPAYDPITFPEPKPQPAPARTTRDNRVPTAA